MNILVTSISRKVPLLLAVKAAGRKLGREVTVTGADLDPACPGQYFTDSFWLMPPLEQLTVEKFLGGCQERGITHVIPTRDGELLYFARNRHYLAGHGIWVLVSAPGAVETCLDKLEFCRRLSRAGFPVIPTAERISEVNSDRLVVKERYGSGGKQIGLNLTREEAARHAAGLSAPVFQPYIQGEEISADLYVDRQGRTKGVILRTRDLVVNGEAQVSTTFRDPRLEELCAALAGELGLYGHAVFQFFRDEEGAYHLIEANPRFGGASTLSIAAGLESFYWFLLETIGGDLDAHLFQRRGEKRLVRYPADLIFDYER